jgi:hypothetical protein
LVLPWVRGAARPVVRPRPRSSGVTGDSLSDVSDSELRGTREVVWAYEVVLVLLLASDSESEFMGMWERLEDMAEDGRGGCDGRKVRER